MSKQFALTVTDPKRVAAFTACFGCPTVYVVSPYPESLLLPPPIGKRQAYKIDRDLITERQSLAYCAYLTKQFGLKDGVADALAFQIGLPVLAEGCTVTVQQSLFEG